MSPTATTRRPRHQSRPRRSRGAFVAVGLVLAVVVVALVVALAAGGDDDGAEAGTDTDTDTEVEPTEAGDDSDATGTGDDGGDSATPLPSYEGPEADDPAIGMALPELTGTDVAGGPMAITADGRPKMVVFLAHWCPHCQREVPVIQDWVDSGALPAGVELVAVATAMDERRPNYPADAWLEREGWSSPVLYDDDSAAELAGLSSFPYFVVTDADGTVVARASGELTEDQLDALAELAASGS